MAFIPADNIELSPHTWVKITERSGQLHLKYDPSTVIYSYEGDDDPTSLYPSPDIHQPLTVISGGHQTTAPKIGKDIYYNNSLGALWMYAEQHRAFVLKVDTLGFNTPLNCGSGC